MKLTRRTKIGNLICEDWCINPLSPPDIKLDKVAIPSFNKDIKALSTYDYDLRKIMTETTMKSTAL